MTNSVLIDESGFNAKTEKNSRLGTKKGRLTLQQFLLQHDFDKMCGNHLLFLLLGSIYFLFFEGLQDVYKPMM